MKWHCIGAVSLVSFDCVFFWFDPIHSRIMRFSSRLAAKYLHLQRNGIVWFVIGTIASIFGCLKMTQIVNNDIHRTRPRDRERGTWEFRIHDMHWTYRNRFPPAVIRIEKSFSKKKKKNWNECVWCELCASSSTNYNQFTHKLFACIYNNSVYSHHSMCVLCSCYTRWAQHVNS